ncbi:MAG: hypothetical protein ACFB5Z_13500 [Elainellaceae cyanobacterium]
MTQLSIRLYATGDLAEELKRYHSELSEALERTVALPHCLLTDDFSAGTLSVTDCVKHLDEAITAAPKQDHAIACVVELKQSSKGYWLNLSSDWVRQAVAIFAESVAPDFQVTPRGSLRYILLSAADMPQDAAKADSLRSLNDSLDWSAFSGWDMTLNRQAEDGWAVEGSWPIQQP